MSEHRDIVGAVNHAIKMAVQTDPPSKAEHNHHDAVLDALCPVCTPSAYATNRAKHRGYPRGARNEVHADE